MPEPAVLLLLLHHGNKASVSMVIPAAAILEGLPSGVVSPAVLEGRLPAQLGSVAAMVTAPGEGVPLQGRGTLLPMVTIS